MTEELKHEDREHGRFLHGEVEARASEIEFLRAKVQTLTCENQELRLALDLFKWPMNRAVVE